MPRPSLRGAITVTCACVIVLALIASPALAAASGESIGTNLGALLRSWAQSLFTGIVALVSIVFLVNRRFTDLAVFLGAAVLVGGLIFASATFASLIKAIWTTVGS